MEVSEIKNEGLERAFKVVIPASEIEEKVMGRLTEIAKTVNLPGFRPGKAPISLLKKKYGLSLTGEILEQTVNDSSVKIMTDNALRPVAQPQIEISKFDDGHDLEFTMNLEVAPEIKPIDFKSIKLERLTAEPDEKEIEDSINRLADSNRSVEKINTDRKSKKGDVLVIDFVGSVDGTEFPGGKAEGYQLDLGSGSFIPGFEDKLIGAGSTKFPRAAVEAYRHSLTETPPRLAYERSNIEGSQIRLADFAAMRDIPVLMVTAEADPDHTKESDQAIVDWFVEQGLSAALCYLPDHNIAGNGHMVMLEKNSDAIAGLIGDWIERVVAS